jgi:diguanylate cyclase (GGDEF)-like protein/PAS domain S-box-containing protein
MSQFFSHFKKYFIFKFYAKFCHWFMNKSIEYKFIFSFVFIFTTFSLILSGLYTKQHYNQEIQKIIKTGTFATQIQSFSLDYPLWNFSNQQINNVLSVLENNSYFMGAAVYDSKNKLIAKVGNIKSDDYTLKFQKDIVHDKITSKEKIGSIETYFTKKNIIKDEFKFSLIFILVVFFACSLMIYIMKIIFNSFFAKPLTQIVLIMQKVALGDLTQNILIKRNDEFGSLATVFNKMLSELRDIYKTIEDKVIERTAEFEQANYNSQHSKKIAERALVELKLEKIRSERLLVDALDMSPAALLLLDKKKFIVMWNQNLVEIYPEALQKALNVGSYVGDAFSQVPLYQVNDNDSHSTLYDTLFSAEENFGPVDVLLANNRWVQITMHKTKDDEYVIMFLDINDIKSREKALHAINSNLAEQTEKLRMSEERYALATLGSNDGMWDWNLATHEIEFSDRFKEMSGLTHVSILKFANFLDFVHSEQRQDLEHALNQHLHGETTRFKYDFQMKQPDETYKWFSMRGMAAFNEFQKPIRIAGSLTDITMQKSYEQELWHTAYHDALTGLANRSLFVEKLRQLLQQAIPLKTAPAILFLDLDRFKLINDSLGHDIGDKLLIGVARRLKRCLRSKDVAARLGGDEFTVILQEAQTPEDVKKVAERILSEFARPFNLDGHEVFVTASIGIAYLDNETKKIDTFLRNADLAMYRAKTRGRACYEVFDTEFHEHIMKELQVETDLRHALKKDHISLVYQPILSLENNQIIGFEGLVRWDDPEQGPVPLNVFLPIAEESGLILQLGEQVLLKACEQVNTWNEMFGDQSVSIAVNLSVKQLRDRAHMNHLINILSSYAFPKGSIKIEITESVLMDNLEANLQILNRLKELNIELCIDDFGTGYSAFNYLYRFPFDILKIDCSFTGKMFETEKNYRLVRGIIGLAHDLGLKVVAEGIEDKGQMEHLQRMNCDYGQGYLFSRPIKSEEAQILLQKQNLSKVSSLINS